MSCLKQKVYMFFKSERGAVIIVVAVLLAFVLLGMVALSVDVGYLYLQKRHQQTTADAAALAAAWHLPWGGADEDLIIPTAQAYISNNNMNESTGTVTPHNGDNDKVKVEITENYPLFFAQAPPISQSDADVYAMAVAMKEYTFVDILPFLMLKYDNLIDYEVWDSLTEEEKTKSEFYSMMKAIVPVEAVFLMRTSAGNWGLSDMTAFSHYSGNLNKTTLHILKYGLDEPFCVGERPGDRAGDTGVKEDYTSPVAASVDGYNIQQRLARDTDFFVPLILPRIGESWHGTHNEFGIDDFIIGHFRPLGLTGNGNNRVLGGTLINVYEDCSQIPNQYKKWFPVLVE